MRVFSSLEEYAACFLGGKSGKRRAPVEVDDMHADMGGHFAPRASSRHGWPAPPDDVEDDGTSTLYRSY